MTTCADNKLMSRLCRSCGLCCTGVDSDVTLVSKTHDATFIPEIPDGTIVRQKGDLLVIRQPCPVFDGRCSKYDLRPLDCRTYECGVLRDYRLSRRTFEESREIIDTLMSGLTGLHARFIEKNPGRTDVDEQSVYAFITDLVKAADKSGSGKQQLRRDYPEYFLLLSFHNRYFLTGE